MATEVNQGLQCRICMSDDYPSHMIKPCACAGSGDLARDHFRLERAATRPTTSATAIAVGVPAPVPMHMTA